VRYRNITPLSPEQADQIFRGNHAEEIVHALLSITHYESDWHWVQDRALSCLHSPSPDVRRTAVLCLGHLARIHGQIDRPKVIAALTKLRTDPECSGQVEDALEDIEKFTQDSA
jgi:hypothetical protein